MMGSSLTKIEFMRLMTFSLRSVMSARKRLSFSCKYFLWRYLSHLMSALPSHLSFETVGEWLSN
jgi:hypothetical protein